MGSVCVFLVCLTLICIINAFRRVVEIQYDENGKPFIEFDGRRYDQTGGKTVTYIDDDGCITTLYLEWPDDPENTVGAVHVNAYKLCD
ncbi:unnamed protein product [Dicrocoelium dendriticum]|nr:unnamed protein product [Dicrocoelium dendriticum]